MKLIQCRFSSGRRVSLLGQAGTELDGYAIWLQSSRQADNLVARIGTAETAPFPYSSSKARSLFSNSFSSRTPPGGRQRVARLLGRSFDSIGTQASR
ncbi:hypothetical protein [Pseudomonas chlororaphis]|uniref:hypothetical protein n=1 Tax=Pseudomonas chlororaphis TaxID=587753 RepID=UPI001B315399|nr:hypothetical protein [Pseudomonas chlororaphis]MBP5073948.1 hypothetical protein [Pseudomonas chlororaphis]QTT85828.1 hypothetical protein HUT28_16680 [Pseudomonas chlororaphis]